MAHHVWSVLCERALVTVDPRGVSLIDVMEELTLITPEGKLPDETVSVPLRLALVSFWTRTSHETAERGHARFKVLSPAGTLLATGHEIAVDLEKQGRAQTVGRIEAMPLHGQGIYHFMVEYRDARDPQWRECARIPLEVSAQAGGAPAPSAADPERESS
jgi:hypothetical protein